MSIFPLLFVSSNHYGTVVRIELKYNKYLLYMSQLYYVFMFSSNIRNVDLKNHWKSFIFNHSQG